MIPVIIKHAADAATRQMEDIAKKQLGAGSDIPTYKEMRATKLHPGMTPKERMAYRAHRVQKGYVGGTVTGGILGGLAGTTLGALIKRSPVGKKFPGSSTILQRYVLPATVGYGAFRGGAILGRKAGEAYARKKLNASGNTMPYINPINMDDRGVMDPTFLASLMGTKSLQAIASEKSREKVEKKLLGMAPRTRIRHMLKTDLGTIKNMIGKLKR